MNQQLPTFQPRDSRTIEIAVISMILIALVLKSVLVFKLNINQDEFHFLSDVHTYLRGELFTPFQTFHVHLFSWLSLISNNEVTQILAARTFLYLFLIGACCFTYLIGRQFLNVTGSLFSVLCYLSFSFVIGNSASFRFDSISVFFLLLSTWLIISKPFSMLSNIISGAAIGLSLVITVKTSIYLVMIGVIFFIFLVFSANRKLQFYRTASFSIALLAAYFLLYRFHVSMLPVKTVNSPEQFFKTAFSTFIILDQLIPAWGIIRISFQHNFIIWGLLFTGVFCTFTKQKKSKQPLSKDSFLPYAFLIPLLSLLVYRNGLPYFYTLILSPAIIFCGVCIHQLVEKYMYTGEIVCVASTGILSIFIFLNFAFFYMALLSGSSIAIQRDFITIVHKIFPKSVTYIDGCSMVPSFSKVGLFMSSAGMESYLKRNKPIMKELIIRSKPKFLIANVPSLDLSLSRNEALSLKKYSLLERDWGVLKTNFIHHWSILYVAGKQFDFNSSQNQNFEIIIDGKYTYEGEKEILIDGKVYNPGETLVLSRGDHTIAAEEKKTLAVLRFGENLFKPKGNNTNGKYFLGGFI